MARVKRGVTARRRHKKILKLAKGYWGKHSRWFKLANQYVMRALHAAYRDRRLRKREFRRLWIARINAICREHGLTYSTFMNALRREGIHLNRKVLADLAVRERETFSRLIERAKGVMKT